MAMPGNLTVAERIVLQLLQHQKLIDSYDVPLDVSQDGIASALCISRAHVAIELKKLRENGEVVEKLAHIKKGKTKRKVYFLTESGELKAAKIKEYAAAEGIDIGPMVDVRRCRGPDLYSSLSKENQSILVAACVFRKPFRREALPETSVALLPTDRNGKVEMPLALRQEVTALVPSEELRKKQSYAADYWLGEGEYRERLYHLIAAGRSKEAEMLLATKGTYLLRNADEDLLDIVSSIESPSDRYAAKVRQMQAETARIAGDHEYCFRVCAEMEGSQDRRERFEGLMIKGKALKDSGRLDEALVSLIAAQSIGLHLDDAGLECEMADVLLRSGRMDEAIGLLDSLLRRERTSDPELIERAYFIIGSAYLAKGMPNEALRYLSKSLAITKAGDRRPWYMGLSAAYAKAGMEDKAKEYDARANPPKKWGEA
jgi:tetratricopeptide (TPR) repeat protein